MASNHSAEKRARKSPFAHKLPKRNATLTPEQTAEHERRIAAEQARVERELLAKLVSG